MSERTPYLSAMLIMDPRGNSGLISLMFPRSGSPGGCGMGTVLSAMLSCHWQAKRTMEFRLGMGWFEGETRGAIEVTRHRIIYDPGLGAENHCGCTTKELVCRGRYTDAQHGMLWSTGPASLAVDSKRRFSRSTRSSATPCKAPRHGIMQC